ncbi:UNVERIFIED_CONTAM: protein TPX2, partial [Sesamum calycinum]
NTTSHVCKTRERKFFEDACKHYDQRCSPKEAQPQPRNSKEYPIFGNEIESRANQENGLSSHLTVASRRIYWRYSYMSKGMGLLMGRHPRSEARQRLHSNIDWHEKEGQEEKKWLRTHRAQKQSEADTKAMHTALTARKPLCNIGRSDEALKKEGPCSSSKWNDTRRKRKGEWTSSHDNIKEKEMVYKRYREEAESARMMEEEKALKQLRRTLVPHARPVPNFDHPFLPQKSAKEVTKAKSPKLLVTRRKEKRRLVCPAATAPSTAASHMRNNLILLAKFVMQI